MGKTIANKMFDKLQQKRRQIKELYHLTVNEVKDNLTDENFERFLRSVRLYLAIEDWNVKRGLKGYIRP